MDKANQLIIDTLKAMGCKPTVNGNLIKVNAPAVNDAKKGDQQK
jgi:hypothetical protein